MVRSLPLAVLTRVALTSFSIRQSGEPERPRSNALLEPHTIRRTPNAKACLSDLFFLDCDRDDCDGVGTRDGLASNWHSAGSERRRGPRSSRHIDQRGHKGFLY